MKFKRDGHLNVVEKNQGFYIRRPKYKRANWDNEIKIFNQLKIPIEWDQKGFLKRLWIKGSTIKKWDQAKLKSLKEAIKKFHSLKTDGITLHNWKKHESYKNLLPVKWWSLMELFITESASDKLVVSHNDINQENVIWDGKKIHLIDFEWANINSIYFDYVSAELFGGATICDHIATKIKKRYQWMILIYCYLWTFWMPESNEVKTWQNQYLKRLKVLANDSFISGELLKIKRNSRSNNKNPNWD